MDQSVELELITDDAVFNSRFNGRLNSRFKDSLIVVLIPSVNIHFDSRLTGRIHGSFNNRFDGLLMIGLMVIQWSF